MTFWIALGKIRPIFQSWNSGFGRHSIRGFRNWKCDWDWNPSSGMLPVLQRLGSALLTVSSYFRLSFRRFRLSLDCLQNVYRMLVVIIHLWSDFNVVEWCERKPSRNFLQPTIIHAVYRALSHVWSIDWQESAGWIYFRGPHWNNSVMHFNGDL